MKIIEKMAAKAKDNYNLEGVTIALLGDSVTQGCFEIYKNENGVIETVFDKRASYEMGVFDILCLLFPSVPVNIINAGISGDTAAHGLSRLERDVLRHEPDLCVVCYGLNDCAFDGESVARYTESLRRIFEKIAESGSELIFMTPNMMNTRVASSLVDPDFIAIAEQTARKQNEGFFDAHVDAAKALCEEMQVKVCDCYALWKRLSECGADTTSLLANGINHPTREMNKAFAYEIVKTMLL